MKNTNIKEEVLETPEVVEEKIEEPVVEEEQLVVGTVVECGRLNIRTAPKKTEDNITCTIPFAATVIVDLAKSKSGWYAVTTDDGVKGFAMKKFINIGK